MRLIIDPIHVAETETGRYWRLYATQGRLRSEVRNNPPKSITCGNLANLADSLAYHRIITPDAAQLASTTRERVQRVAERFAADLKNDPTAALVFDDRRFIVERGLGDWIVGNPGKTVARLRDGKNFVGAWPNLASAMFATVELKLHKSEESLAYSQVDSVMEAIADTLLRDARIIDRSKIVEPEPELGPVVHVLSGSGLVAPLHA
jgi:hypothetical protein